MRLKPLLQHVSLLSLRDTVFFGKGGCFGCPVTNFREKDTNASLTFHIIIHHLPLSTSFYGFLY
jgi:hypothetical protein